MSESSLLLCLSAFSPVEHYHRKESGGENLQLVHELVCRPFKVARCDVVEVVLHHIQTGRDRHLKKIDWLLQQILPNSLLQLPETTPFLIRADNETFAMMKVTEHRAWDRGDLMRNSSNCTHVFRNILYKNKDCG